MAGLEYIANSTLPPGFTVWIDRDKYEKILYNLLSNVRFILTPGQRVR
jgi:hypothetical protein